MASRKRGLTPDGDAIRDARNLKDWTQQQLAKKAELNVEDIGRAEKGMRKSLEHLELIALALTGKKDVTPFLKKDERTNVRVLFNRFMEECLKLGWPGTVTQDWKNNGLILHDVLDLVMKKGSVIIEMSLTKGDARRLMNAFLSGRLDHLKIKSITVGDESFAKTEVKEEEVAGSVAVSEVQQSDALLEKETEKTESGGQEPISEPEVLKNNPNTEAIVEDLYPKYYKSIINVARSYGLQNENAKEIAQMVIHNAYSSLSRDDIITNAAAWIMSIVNPRIKQLPTNERAVIQLFIMNYTHDEIAEHLGISVKLVSRLLHGAREKLRRRLKTLIARTSSYDQSIEPDKDKP